MDYIVVIVPPVDLDMPLSVYTFSTSWCPSDMYIKLHLCRVLEASGSILVDIGKVWDLLY